MILVTQSFGRESEYRRVVVAILSFYAHTSNREARTVLFTDNPSWFAPFLAELPVDYILLTPEKIRQMRGQIDFLHRMKIALIEEAFAVYQADMLYLDSDTFFVADPIPLMQQLAPQKSFMHVHEYRFESLRHMPLPAGETFQAFVRLIEKAPFSLSEGQLAVHAEMSSWNAGVMMLHKSHATLIPDVYRLTDQFFPATQNHASEQYAFSVMLQTRTALSACEAVIYHYWYGIKKNIIDAFLQEKIETIRSLPLEKRLSTVKTWTSDLPSYFERHLWALKDKAIQAYNTDAFGQAFAFSGRALFKGAIFDLQFIKDIAYHIRRKVFKKA